MPQNHARTPEEILMTDMTAEGLRRFCSREGVERTSGATKAETIAAIMTQKPGAAIQWLEAQGYELMSGYNVENAEESRDEEEGGDSRQTVEG